MSKVKIILFNGPPRSGKDTAAAMVYNKLIAMEEDSGYMPILQKMATPLKDATHALYGQPGVSTDHYESAKDLPCGLFLGASPRQAYIALSEKCIKPHYGKDFFGKLFVNLIKGSPALYNRIVICSDLGFSEEADVLAKAFGAENILIVQLSRRGCDFKNDSRDYIRVPGVKTCRITNEDIIAFKLEVYHKVRFWIDNGVVSREPVYA